MFQCPTHLQPFLRGSILKKIFEQLLKQGTYLNNLQIIFFFTGRTIKGEDANKVQLPARLIQEVHNNKQKMLQLHEELEQLIHFKHKFDAKQHISLVEPVKTCISLISSCKETYQSCRDLVNLVFEM